MQDLVAVFSLKLPFVVSGTQQNVGDAEGARHVFNMREVFQHAGVIVGVKRDAVGHERRSRD